MIWNTISHTESKTLQLRPVCWLWINFENWVYILTKINISPMHILNLRVILKKRRCEPGGMRQQLRYSICRFALRGKRSSDTIENGLCSKHKNYRVLSFREECYRSITMTNHGAERKVVRAPRKLHQCDTVGKVISNIFCPLSNWTTENATATFDLHSF